MIYDKYKDNYWGVCFIDRNSYIIFLLVQNYGSETL